jgi:DNA-binding transcriptional LysR family regulator
MADRRLQVFHAVAKQGSFTRAAETLFMTQPAVTFQIKQLEEQFNCRLFERQHLKISLTPAGELVLGYVEKILALSEEMDGRVAEMTGQMGGALTVGACTTLGDFALPKVLGAFNEQYPQVQLRLVVGNSESIHTRISEGTLDVGFVGSVDIQKGVQTEKVSVEELKIICAPGYPLAAEKAVEAKTLLEYEYISREPGSGTRAAIESYLNQVGVLPQQLKTIMELGSPMALKRVALGGVGFAIMSPDAVADELASGALVAIPLQPPLQRDLTMIMPKERFRSRTIGTFADFVKSQLRSHEL